MLLSHPDNTFSGKILHISAGFLNLTLHLLQQHGFIMEVWELTWPVVQTFHELKTSDTSRNKQTNKQNKCHEEHPGLLSSLNPLSDKIRTTFLSQESSSQSPPFPDVVRRTRHPTQWETWPFPNFFNVLFKMKKYFFFKKRIHLICPIFNLLWLKYGSVTFANQFFIYICLHSVPTVVIWICTYLADTVNQNVGDWLSRRNLCLALFFSCLVCLTDS